MIQPPEVWLYEPSLRRYFSRPAIAARVQRWAWLALVRPCNHRRRGWVRGINHPSADTVQEILLNVQTVYDLHLRVTITPDGFTVEDAPPDGSPA